MAFFSSAFFAGTGFAFMLLVGSIFAFFFLRGIASSNTEEERKRKKN